MKADLLYEPLLITAKQVRELVNISRTTWYELVRAKLAPKPIKLGTVTRWSLAEIKLWVQRGCPSMQILKRQLAKERKEKNRKNVDELSDTYIRQLLTYGTELCADDIPQELVAVKKIHLALTRSLKGAKK